MDKTGEKNKNNWLGLLLKFIVPAVISTGLCYLLFRDFDFGEMWRVIRTECDFSWILAALLISVLSYIFRAMRWGIQLSAIGVRPPLFYLILSIFGTYAVNLVFPRLGEVWRCGYIAQRQKAPFTAVFGSMIADRIADTLTVFLILLFTLVVARDQLLAYLAQNQALYDSVMGLLRSPWVWAAAVVSVAFLWWFLTRRTRIRWVCRIQQAVRELWTGFAAIFRMPHKGQWLILTFAIWSCFFLQLFLAFFAFGFTEQIIEDYGVIAVQVTFVLSSIAMAVPSNGGIGPYQWAVMFALGMYGLDPARGGAFANLVLGCNTLFLIILGLFTFISIAISRRTSLR